MAKSQSTNTDLSPCDPTHRAKRRAMDGAQLYRSWVGDAGAGLIQDLPFNTDAKPKPVGRNTIEKTMTEDLRARQRRRRRIWLALSALLGILIGVIVPPLVSMRSYKSSITRLMSESLGRPVRLSSVELRLLPRPGFVLTDLTVAEDPAYGAEPVLHANSVTAYIRLLSLWRGRLEIGTISVDEASLNVVRTPEGRWNLDSLFRTAAAKTRPNADGQAKRVMPLPYLEATNSRINFKRGAEKLPFSLVETDLSFWQEQPGDWHIRLRGQPARTDLSLDLADTGLVRLEARVQRSPELRHMPLHLDMEWREAQLGQLTRLLIGSDPGWRGDLTGELHLDGTAEAAQIKTRLRATGVHRAEFAPVAAMDFDASCGLLYHFSARSVENLACDSPFGDGRIHLAGELPGGGGQSHLSVELNQIPVAAGLDALRTVRSDFGPGLQAAGTISGKMSYAAVAPADSAPLRQEPRKRSGNGRTPKVRPTVPQPLTGTFTVAGFQLSGGGLSTPIQAAKLVLEPVGATAKSDDWGSAPEGDQPQALETTMAVLAGGAGPLTISARLATSGYRISVHGQASVARGRELARMAGLPDASVLDALAGDPVTLDLKASGPWLPAAGVPFAENGAPQSLVSRDKPADAQMGKVQTAEAKAETKADPAQVAAVDPVTDSWSGTVTLHNATWRADYLANHVQIAEASLHVGPDELRWDPIVFSYGPVKGTASLRLPVHCEPGRTCPPTFAVQFGDLNAGVLQAAILGAHEPGTLLSDLIAKLRPSDAAPAWPMVEGSVKAESLLLGPVTLRRATANLRILPTGAEIADLDADLLGGHVHGGGTLATGANPGKPAYTLDGRFDKINAAAVGQLLGESWTGRSLDGDGKIALSGFTDKDLATSAKGTLHFDWRSGAVKPDESSKGAAATPAVLRRFDHWTADAEVDNGAIALKENQVQLGSRKSRVEGAVTFGNPPKVSFELPKAPQAKH
jgi:hypothetical protein